MQSGRKTICTVTLEVRSLKYPLSPHTLAAADSTDTQAALIVRSGSSIVDAVIQKVLLPAQLMEIQLAVINGITIPEY